MTLKDLIESKKKADNPLKFQTKDKNGKCVYCNKNHQVLVGASFDKTKHYINCPECEEGKKLTAAEKAKD